MAAFYQPRQLKIHMTDNEIKVKIYDLSEEINALGVQQQEKIAEIQKLKTELADRSKKEKSTKVKTTTKSV